MKQVEMNPRRTMTRRDPHWIFHLPILITIFPLTHSNIFYPLLLIPSQPEYYWNAPLLPVKVRAALGPEPP